MRYTYLKRDIPAGSPIANALVIVAGAVIVGITLVLGFFAFLVLGTLVLILAAFIGIRLWWLRRKLAKRSDAPDNKSGPGGSTDVPSGGVIEGEFRVVREEDDHP